MEKKEMKERKNTKTRVFGRSVLPRWSQNRQDSAEPHKQLVSEPRRVAALPPRLLAQLRAALRRAPAVGQTRLLSDGRTHCSTREGLGVEGVYPRPPAPSVLPADSGWTGLPSRPAEEEEEDQPFILI